MTSDFTQKNALLDEVYNCDDCCFKTSNKFDYSRHVKTPKHKNTYKYLQNDLQKNAKNANSQLFICNCGNKYKHRQSLYTHKKKCISEKTDEKKDDNTEPTDKELILLLLKQNNDLQNKVLEVCKNGIITNNNTITNTNTNTNSHNKTFNLNFFLNETCKNAMNITDFVDSIKLQLSDLESVGRIGYIEGLSKIIIKNLNALDVTERPVHCSDSKRDTMYVKDEDKWEKDSEENPTVLKAIEDIANKNTKQVKEWKIKNPECASSKSCKADQYSHIVIEVVCSNNDANNKKVLKKIAKEITIDKS